MTELGLDDGTIRRALPRIRELLSGPDPLTRHEIAGALATRGVQIDRAGQAPIHLVRRACLEGIAVEVGTRDGEPVYHLLDGWLPGEPCADRSAALARLARRYLDAHQPAGLGDFAGWSGLPAADVRAGWRAVAGDMTAFDAGGRLWCLGEPPPADGDRDEPTVRLLPAFDGYLLGYADRTHAVDDEHAAAVHPGGGIIRPTLVVDGVCVATWRIDRPRRVGRVVVRPLVALSSTVIGGLSTEVADIGRFLGQSMEVEFEHA